MRAMASVEPPAANGATMVSGRFGQSCAFAGCATTIAAATTTKVCNAFIDARPSMSPHYSALIPEARMTFDHFAISALKNAVH